jgi:hypothetical protein
MKRKIVVAGLVVVLGTAAWFRWTELRPGGQSAAEKVVVDPYSPDRMRGALLSYLAQPAMSGGEFEAQLLGGAHLELYRLDRQSLYFSLPRNDTEPGYPASVFPKFLLNPADARLAAEDRSRLSLDEYSLPRTPNRWHFFVTPAQNFKIDPGTTLRFAFQRCVYTVSLRETVDFLRAKSVVGGLLNAATGAMIAGRVEVMINHGAFVAVVGEPSLQRFAQELVKEIPDGETGREQRIQRLLDFVSEEIAYDHAEAAARIELMKRPNETLMTRRADCSNKAILLASLLAQVGEQPLLVYMPGHISVAVPQGRFPNESDLTLSWQGVPWAIAEPTTPGFQIGRTRVTEESLRTFRFVQSVKEPNTIISLASGKPLSFR